MQWCQRWLANMTGQFSTVNIEANVYIRWNKKSFNNQSGNPIHRKTLLLKDISYTDTGMGSAPISSNKENQKKVSVSHHYQAGKVKDFARIPTRPHLEGKKLPCQKVQNGYILHFMDWATINNSPKRQRPSPQIVFHSGEQPHLILMLKMADSSMFCLG